MRSTKPAQISYVQKCTTNIRVNQMQKYHAFFKYFIFMDMNNQMITNHLCISVNDNTVVLISPATDTQLSIGVLVKNQNTK